MVAGLDGDAAEKQFKRARRLYNAGMEHRPVSSIFWA
jgi:hypothetical protein